MPMLTVLSHFFSQTCGWRHGWSRADVDRNLCTFWCVRMVRGGDCLAGKLLVFFGRLVVGCKAKRLLAETFLLYGNLCVSKTCLQGFDPSLSFSHTPAAFCWFIPGSRFFTCGRAGDIMVGVPKTGQTRICHVPVLIIYLTDLGYCLPVVAPCSLRMILSWRYNVLGGPSGFWSTDMLKTYVWQKRAGRFVGLGFPLRMTTSYTMTIYLFAPLNWTGCSLCHRCNLTFLFMRCSCNTTANKNWTKSFIVYEVLQVNRFFSEVPGLCCFCCACIPAHPMIQWHIRHGLRLVPSSSMSLRVCVIKPLSSLLRPLGWPPRSAHFELDGFDSSLGAIIDVYNWCVTGGKQLI